MVFHYLSQFESVRFLVLFLFLLSLNFVCHIYFSVCCVVVRSKYSACTEQIQYYVNSKTTTNKQPNEQKRGKKQAFNERKAKDMRKKKKNTRQLRRMKYTHTETKGELSITLPKRNMKLKCRKRQVVCCNECAA